MKIWMDGKLVTRAEARVSVYDHGLLYGDGVFEGIRAYGDRVFQLQAHIDRLYESARHIRVAIPYTKQELAEATRETVRANKLSDSYIRPVITRGEGNLGLNPFSCPQPHVFIINDQVRLYPKEMYEHGMAVIISKTIRTSARMLPPSVKSLNYLNNILAKIECIDAGVSEAIMLNDAGNVAECTGDNIFMVTGGRLVTPPTDADILNGITRSVVLRLAGELRVPLAERNFTPSELYKAEECFLTGTAAEVIPVTKVDHHTIADGKVGPLTRKLSKAFHEFTRSSSED